MSMYIKYKEISKSDWDSLALILTENGKGEDIEINFIRLDDGTAQIMIRIIPEKQLINDD